MKCVVYVSLIIIIFFYSIAEMWEKNTESWDKFLLWKLICILKATFLTQLQKLMVYTTDKYTYMWFTMTHAIHNIIEIWKDKSVSETSDNLLEHNEVGFDAVKNSKMHFYS